MTFLRFFWQGISHFLARFGFFHILLQFFPQITSFFTYYFTYYFNFFTYVNNCFSIFFIEKFWISWLCLGIFCISYLCFVDIFWILQCPIATLVSYSCVLFTSMSWTSFCMLKCTSVLFLRKMNFPFRPF